MKKFLLTAATAAAALTTLSADQFYVIMKDGSVESYPTEKVDSISFNDPQIAKIMGFNEMAAELIKLKARVAALEAKSGTVVDSSATSNASDLRYFVINDKEVEVSGIINGSTEIIIPSTAFVNGRYYNVTSIGRSAFENQERIKKIKVPSSVTFVGYRAFYNCDDLDITIDNSRNNVYFDEDKLNLPRVKSVTFTGNPLLFQIDGSSAYVSNGKVPGLKSVTIPSEVEVDGKVYPVTSINTFAFSGCNLLTNVEIPSSVTSIGQCAFSGCRSLSNVEIPSGVTTIESSAFSGCYDLASIKIPSSVISIGSSAFSGCHNLDVVIDNSRSNVECDGAFDGVKSVTFTGSQFLFKVLEDGESAKIAYADYSGYESITIPSEAEINRKKYPVTAIGDSAFYNCSILTSVIIPSSVTSIGYSAFYDCSSLTSIEIPSSVTSIEYNAFYGRENLDVVIDNSKENIPEEIFRDCKSVKYLK